VANALRAGGSGGGLVSLGLLQTGLGASGAAQIAEAIAANGGNKRLTSLDLGLWTPYVAPLSLSLTLSHFLFKGCHC